MVIASPRSEPTRPMGTRRYGAVALAPHLTIAPLRQPDPSAIVEAHGHPIRRRILTALSERPGVTIREIADRLGEPPRRVRHHVEALVDRGVAEVIEDEGGPGIAHRRYGAGPLEVNVDGSMGVDESTEMARATVRLVMGDVATAVAAGTLGRRRDDHEIRMYGEVGEACLEELIDLHWQAYTDISETLIEGRERLRQSGRSGTEVTSAIFFFEAPLWGSTSSRRSSTPVADPASDALAGLPEAGAYPDPHTFAKACRHPLRARILTAFSDRPGATIREVAEHLGETTRRVRHHVEALVELGLVVVTSSEILSGVLQRRYGAGPLAVEETTIWCPSEQADVAKSVARLVAADLAVASAAETLADGKDEFEVRMYGEVDDLCLEELGELHRAAYGRIRRTIEEGRKQHRRSGGPGTEVVSALFFFEVPLWSRALGRE
jgi:DNA-binding transcriptional ArsR family regulator